jgi:hypothetical protein
MDATIYARKVLKNAKNYEREKTSKRKSGEKKEEMLGKEEKKER